MQVCLDTSAGNILIDVFVEQAPKTAAYFLKCVQDGSYDGTTFYRSTTLGIDEGPRLIQGGPLSEFLAGASPRESNRSRPPMLEDFETTVQTGLRHQRGTVSLARDLLNTGFPLADIFICLGDFPQLDFEGRSEPDTKGFPAFGAVVSDLDIVETIAEGATEGSTPIAMLEGQILTDLVSIHRAYLP